MTSKFRECLWQDATGQWHEKESFNSDRARSAVRRIERLTGVRYVKYRCRKCQRIHLRYPAKAAVVAFWSNGS